MNVARNNILKLTIGGGCVLGRPIDYQGTRFERKYPSGVAQTGMRNP